MLKSLFATLLLMVVSGSILACSLVPPRPGTYSLNDRLSAFPKRGALTRPVEVRWSNQAIPFIEAQVDDDVPYAIGLVQAHLRLSQLELFRRAVYGRLAESGGYLAVKIDHALRTLNLPRVAPEIEARLPRETARWIERFVEGINDYKRSVTDRGADFRLLDLPEDPWTVRDVLAISRLGGIDVNWFTLLGSLSLQDDPGWPEVWSRILAH